MTSNYTQEEIKNIKEQSPLEKIGDVNNISKCVGWLIDDDYTTGQIISVNGGWVI